MVTSLTHTGQKAPLGVALERAGLSQAALARALDCHPTAVSRWVRGKVRPHRFYRRRIVSTLRRHGVDVTEGELWP